MEHFKQRVLDKVDEQIMDLENLKNCINDCDDERALLAAIDEFFSLQATHSLRLQYDNNNQSETEVLAA